MTKREITQLSYEITGLAIKVHKALGPGLLESIYEVLKKPQGLLINFFTSNITKSLKPFVTNIQGTP